MLSIGKLGFGHENYYLDTVAHGAEDYYVGRGEAPGRWLGRSSGGLGLDGTVGHAALRAVLDGRDPSDGNRLGRTRSRRVPGFDLTFRAPKSVSVLWGLGDRDTVRAVRDAHDTAVAAALGYLEREACWARRGTDGVEQVHGSGFVAAGFRHRTSRAGDPHLHTHVLIANATRAADGRWSALDARHLYLHAKTAGYLYEAQLRVELTRRLGVEWQPVRNGIADLTGIPAEVLRVFSTRRAEIEDEMNRRGVSSARAAQYAALETRQAKDHAVDPIRLHDRWADTAAGLGFDAEELRHLLHRTRPRNLDPSDIDAISTALLGSDGLTKQASTFDRRDVLRAWCDGLPAGADVATIEHLADRMVSAPEVVPLRAVDQRPARPMRRQMSGTAMSTPLTGVRYSTEDLLALEARVIDTALRRRGAGVGIADDASVLAALGARPGLSSEQAEMVATLTTIGRGIDVVVAPAGTGKTFALDAARDAWQRSGHTVIGAALAARAAAELQATAGIESHTIARLLADLDDARHGGLPDRCVLVVDEAGMAGTRQLARLVDHADATDAKIVLIGDPRQLPEIDAGGLLRGLAARGPAIRLTHNRRQHNPWERDALAQLREGHIDEAVAAYQHHGRIAVHETAFDARNHLVADWHAATIAGEHALMLAARRADVDDLNARARHHIDTRGALHGPILIVDDRPYQHGDRVMTLRNDRRLGVRNGTVGTVDHVDLDARTLTMRTDTGTTIALPARYLDAGHLTHAYALTIHKAQGQTADRALILGSDTLYQEAGYVALSRGREENRLYLVETNPRPEAHTPEPEPEPLDALSQSLATSRAQHLAVDHHIDRDAILEDLRTLVDEREQLEDLHRECPANPAHELRALDQQRTALVTQLAAAQHRLEQLDSTRTLRHRAERRAQRLVLTNQTGHLTTRLDTLDELTTRAKQNQAVYNVYRRKHGKDLDQLPQVTRDIEHRLHQLVDADLTEPPAYLRPLGAPPVDSDALARWRGAATYIERYRLDHDINDAKRPLGPQPQDATAILWRGDVRLFNEMVRHIETPAIEHELDISL